MMPSSYFCTRNMIPTRKSSYVNTSGILPTTSQVLALQLCPLMGDTPIQSQWGYPHRVLMGKGTHLVLMRVSHPVPTGSLLAGWGYPLSARWGYPMSAGWEYPPSISTGWGTPPGVDRHTDTGKTLPYCRTMKVMGTRP